MPVWLTRLCLRLHALLSRSHDRELRDELQLHIDLLTDEYQAGGLSAADARARAHRKFGNATRMQETSHDLFAFATLEGLMSDVVYAIREMRRGPGFTAVAVLSLAVGIGTVTGVFALVDAFMLRHLPVPAPDRLVAFSTSGTAAWSRWSSGAYGHWADAPGAAFDVAAVYALSPLEQPHVIVRDGQTTITMHVSVVSGTYFDVLGVPMAAGRGLTPADDREPAGHAVAVISDRLWDRHFGRAADIVGRGLELNGGLYEIVGVTRRGFMGDWVGQPTDVWLPLSVHAAITRAQNLSNEQSTARWLRVLARLRPGVGPEEATASANFLYQQYQTAHPAIAQSWRDRGERIALASAARGYAPERQGYAQPLMVLAAIAALVLIVACTNFANLLFARAEARQREVDVRLALGAGRWRIVRQSLTECSCLAVVAGVCGLVVSAWVTTAILKWFGEAIQPIELDLVFSRRMLACGAACIGLVVAAGLVPCLRACRPSRHLGLATSASRSHGSARARRTLLVGQLALCTVLLTGAGLMLRTVGNLRSQGLGFDRNVLLVTLALDRAGYTGAPGAMLIQRVRERLRAIHGIENVSTTRAGVLDPRAYWIDASDRLIVDGQDPIGGARWTATDVGLGFFETIGMPIVRGRAFDDGDFGPATDVIVINETMATLLFGRQDPIGRRIGIGATSPRRRVVGVVNDARQVSPRDRGMAVVYRPLVAAPPQVILAVRTRDAAADAVDVVRHQLESVDSGLPIVSVRTIDEVLDDAIAQERLMSTLGAWLGTIVILVTCVGLYALISYEVTRRKREIGVRLALGSTRGGVARLVLRDCWRLVGLGLAVGAPLSLAAARPLSSWLFELDAHDPQTIACVIVLLFAVALVAAIRPARAAARIDPVTLLRAE